MKSELFSRKTEETSRTDRAKEKFQEKGTQLKSSDRRNRSYEFQEG